MLDSNRFIAPYALLPEGWCRDVRIDVGADGTIADITRDSPRSTASLLAGPVVPGMPNVHSHTFQRAFAGRAEREAGGDGTFWSWRSAMYAFAGRITPDALEAIAAQVYVDMLEAGYTAVGEFHYVHHDVGGAPFAVRSEMSQRILAAAERAGIGVTLLPVLYRYADFGARPPLPEQARFVNGVDAFVRIYDELAPLCRTPDRRLGIAPHSLRAVGPDDLRDVVAAIDARDAIAPVHLHVAEQEGEVDAAIRVLGARPVEWLLAHAPLGPRWCAVHATHMTPAETAGLAASGAVAGLAPTTEANLGDGLFPLASWRAAHGVFAIGSDSHAGVDPAEELRWLEYGGRLTERRRGIAPSPHALYVDAAAGGARALGRRLGVLEPGRRADFVVLDDRAPALYGADVETLLDRHVIAGGARTVRDVFVGGRRVVSDGAHHARAAVAERYRAVLDRLIA